MSEHEFPVPLLSAPILRVDGQLPIIEIPLRGMWKPADKMTDVAVGAGPSSVKQGTVKKRPAATDPKKAPPEKKMRTEAEAAPSGATSGAQNASVTKSTSGSVAGQSAAKRASKTPAKPAASKTPAKRAASKTPAKPAASKTPAKRAVSKTSAKRAVSKTPGKQASGAGSADETSKPDTKAVTGSGAPKSSSSKGSASNKTADAKASGKSSAQQASSKVPDASALNTSSATSGGRITSAAEPAEKPAASDTASDTGKGRTAGKSKTKRSKAESSDDKKITRARDPESKRNRKEEFHAKIISTGATLVSEYIDTQKTVQAICGDCGEVRNVTPHNFLRPHVKSICYTCSGRGPEYMEPVVRLYIARLKGEMVGKYVNNTTEIEFKCELKHTFKAKWSQMIYKDILCPKCKPLKTAAYKKNVAAKYLFVKLLLDGTGDPNPGVPASAPTTLHVAHLTCPSGESKTMLLHDTVPAVTALPSAPPACTDAKMADVVLTAGSTDVLPPILARPLVLEKHVALYERLSLAGDLHRDTLRHLEALLLSQVQYYLRGRTLVMQGKERGISNEESLKGHVWDYPGRRIPQPRPPTEPENKGQRRQPKTREKRMSSAETKKKFLETLEACKARACPEFGEDGSFRDANLRVWIKCCNGHIEYVKPSNAWSKTQAGVCNSCAGNDKEAVELAFRYVIDSEFHADIKGEYNGANKTVDVKCSEGHDCRPCWSTVREGNGICNGCAGHDPKVAKEEFEKAITTAGFKRIGQYADVSTPIEVECPKAHQIKVYPWCFKTAPRCRECHVSKYAATLRALLSDVVPTVAFVSEYQIPPKDRRRYDFGNAQLVIEVDGQQHFHEIFFHSATGVSSFEHRRKVDYDKTQKALQSGRRIIRFDYTWFHKTTTAEKRSFLQRALDSSAKFIVTDLALYEWLSDLKPVVV